MSDLAQWIAYQRRATVFGTPEETVLALLDVAEALDALREEYVGAEDMLPRTTALRIQSVDAALARLAEVKHG